MLRSIGSEALHSWLQPEVDRGTDLGPALSCGSLSALWGASANERTRTSEPHGNTHPRPPSHGSVAPVHYYAWVFQRMLGLSE